MGALPRNASGTANTTYDEHIAHWVDSEWWECVQLLKTAVAHVTCRVRADTDGCAGVECGEGGFCTDATAPATGYSCSCGEGYTGDDVDNGAVVCEGMSYWMHAACLLPHDITHSLLLNANPK